MKAGVRVGGGVTVSYGEREWMKSGYGGKGVTASYSERK